MTAIKKFVRDESGASLVEYSAALAVILIASVIFLMNIGVSVSSIFSGANTKMAQALNQSGTTVVGTYQ